MRINGSRFRMISLIVLWAILGYIAYLRWWPMNIIDLQNPFPVLNSPVKLGEAVNYRTIGTKHVDIVAEISRILVGPSTYTYPVIPGAHGKGNYNEISDSTVIPDHMPPGRYRIDFALVYPINHFRKVRVNYETEWFEVIDE